MKILTRKEQKEIYNILAQVRCTTFDIYVKTVNEAEIINHINREIGKRTEEIAGIIGGIDGEIEVSRLSIAK